MTSGTLNSDQIVVGGTATVWVGPAGGWLPTEWNDDPSSNGFLSVGYTTTQGMKFKLDTQSKGVFGHQSFYTLRQIIETRAASIGFQMMEFDHKTIPLAFGGGEITTTPGGGFKYTPPAPETVDERSMILDVQDGDTVLRFVSERGMVANTVETDFMRTDASTIPIEFSTLAAITDGVQPWFLLSNATGFGAVEAGS